eukprot:357218-Chlamydomonas_euryale.AAC.34
MKKNVSEFKERVERIEEKQICRCLPPPRGSNMLVGWRARKSDEACLSKAEAKKRTVNPSSFKHNREGLSAVRWEHSSVVSCAGSTAAL